MYIYYTDCSYKYFENIHETDLVWVFFGFFFGFFFLFFIYYKEWVNTVLKLFKKDNGMVALYFSSLLLETSACEYRV